MRYASAQDAAERQRVYPDLAPDLEAHDFQRRRVGSVARFVGAGETVLDVGCNSGYFVGFVPQAAEVHGVDVNPDLVEVARGVLASARVAPAEALPFGERAFDVVNVSGVLEQCFDPAAVLREAARVARRAVTGTTTHAAGTWGKRRVAVHRWQSHSFDEGEISELLSEVGEIAALSIVYAGNPQEPQCWAFCVDVTRTRRRNQQREENGCE